jgi:hypothetical protein
VTLLSNWKLSDQPVQYSLYYGRDSKMLKFVPSTIHALLHCCSYALWLGPPHFWWSFVMERFCQKLSPLVGSKSQPYKSLQNALLLRQRIAICKKIYPSVAEALREDDDDKDKIVRGEQMVVGEMVFRSPVTTHKISRYERRLLVGSFSTELRQSQECVKSRLPKEVRSWSQVKFDEERDRVDASDLKGPVSELTYRRDASWVIVSSFQAVMFT